MTGVPQYHVPHVAPAVLRRRVTESYTRQYRLFRRAAERCGLAVTAVRCLVAMAERGGSARLTDIADDLDLQCSSVSSQLGFLYNAQLVDGDRRQGVKGAEYTLTEAGWQLAEMAVGEREAVVA